MSRWWWPFRRRTPARPELPVAIARTLALMVARRAADLGLVVVGDCSARELVTDGKRIASHHEWCDVEANETAIMTSAISMLKKIAREHGPGRVWTLPNLEIVHVIYDDGMMIKLDANRRWRVRLRALYFHESCGRPLTSLETA